MIKKITLLWWLWLSSSRIGPEHWLAVQLVTWPQNGTFVYSFVTTATTARKHPKTFQPTTSPSFSTRFPHSGAAFSIPNFVVSRGSEGAEPLCSRELIMPGQQQLIQAARTGENKEVLRLLENDYRLDVNAVVPEVVFGGLRYWQRVGDESRFVAKFTNCTALHVATYFRQFTVVETLLEHGAKIGLVAESIAFCPQSQSDPKWKYDHVTSLHLSVLGEECPYFITTTPNDKDGVSFETKMRETFGVLARHLWRRLRGSEMENREEETTIVKGIVEAKGTACWYYRAEPQTLLREATALHFATYFSEGSLKVLGNDGAMDDMLDLLQASKTTTYAELMEDWESTPIRRGRFVSILRLTNSFKYSEYTKEELDFYCNRDVSQLARGYRSAWRKQVRKSLDGRGIGIDNEPGAVLEILRSAQMSSSDVIVDVLEVASEKELSSFMEEAKHEETQLLRIVLDTSSDIVI